MVKYGFSGFMLFLFAALLGSCKFEQYHVTDEDCPLLILNVHVSVTGYGEGKTIYADTRDGAFRQAGLSVSGRIDMSNTVSIGISPPPVSLVSNSLTDEVSELSGLTFTPSVPKGFEILFFAEDGRRLNIDYSSLGNCRYFYSSSYATVSGTKTQSLTLDAESWTVTTTYDLSLKRGWNKVLAIEAVRNWSTKTISVTVSTVEKYGYGMWGGYETMYIYEE